VVEDQIGQPTWTRDVADLVHRLIHDDAPPGTYHATSAGRTSWFGFAQEVVAAAGLDPTTVHPITSREFVRPAPRPSYSVLAQGALEALGITPIDDWQKRWAEAAEEVLAQGG
jgi:dTDP-4-dehydrorhamnose reductase